MKRFGLFLLVTMAAAIFTSCNDSDGDYPRLSAFATVKTLENNDFYFMLDDGKTIYPGDKSRRAHTKRKRTRVRSSHLIC